MKRQIPNILTCINLAIGAIGIYYILTIDYEYAFYFVIAASLFDFLDGFAARLLKVQSEIGKQLDSLADLVSFGLLPSFFMLQWLLPLSDFHAVAILIAVFSAIRLAIFNTDDSQTDHFKGLPTPANALMLTSLLYLSFNLYEYTLLSICVFSCIMLVSPIRLVALKFSGFQWSGNQERWIIIIGTLVLAGVFQETSLPYIIPFYLIVSMIAFFAGKR